MKNAKEYEKKIKKLLTGLSSHRSAQQQTEPVMILLESVLQSDASVKQAKSALALLLERMVDLNELRIAPGRDIVEYIGRDYPGGREKADMINRMLNAIFDKSSSVSMEYMTKMPKRELRRYLLEIGANEYVAAALTMLAFGGHAIPVDRNLLDSLAIGGYVPQGSTIEEVQGFLERVISQKDAAAAHAVLRKFVDDSAAALAKKRKADADAAAKTAAKAAADAAAKEKALAEKQAMKTARLKKRVKEARPRQIKAKAVAKKTPKVSKRTAKSSKKK